MQSICKLTQNFISEKTLSMVSSIQYAIQSHETNKYLGKNVQHPLNFGASANGLLNFKLWQLDTLNFIE